MLAEQPGSMAKSEQRKRLGSGMCRRSVGVSVVVAVREAEGEGEAQSPPINSETRHYREGVPSRDTSFFP